MSASARPAELARLRSDLLAWFDRNKRDLPWRRTRDPYAIWISEVMLQQTQVQTVIPYWQRFLERFPTVRELARAELPDVFALWKGLGYYSRARNLHRAAQAIVEEHGGVLPSSADALLKLPGFGRYTAGAVASIAFGQRAPLVDGNVARVFARIFEVEGAPGDRVREKRLWELAEQLVRDESRPGDLNQSLMELGATVCRTDSPTCLLCPARTHCGALASGRVDELPPPRVRAARQQLRLAVAAWRDGDALLFARRAEGGLFGGLWELPAVEVPEKAPASELEKAITSLIGQAEIVRAIGSVRRTLTHRELTLDVFEVSGKRARLPKSASVQEWRWATVQEAGELGMSTAMAKAVALAFDASGTMALSGPKRGRKAVSRAEPRGRPPAGAR